MTDAEEKQIIIVGAGFSGLCMAIQLQLHQFYDFTIIEKSQEVGGTWWENKYPGAECDVESHLYSYSFEPNPNWSRVFSGSDEIQQYLRHCAVKYNLLPSIRFGEVVQGIEWNGEYWMVSTSKKRYRCQFVVLSSSPLHYASYPNIPGIHDFQGKILHTSKWDRSFDFAGKKVGMIGCGASGIQAVPYLQRHAAQLIVHQRTPQWILPKGNRSFTAIEKFLFRFVPGYGRFYRFLLNSFHEFFLQIFYKGSIVAKLAMWIGKCHLYWTIRDPLLRQQLTPDYPIGCKRILLTDNFYQALNKPNVTPIIRDPIDRITEHSMIVKGKDYPMDVLVLATGFDITGGLNAIKIYDHTISMTEPMNTQAIDAEFYGIYVTNLKNFFTLVGFNAGSTYTSIILYIEAQVKHIVTVLQYMKTYQKRIVEIHPNVFQTFNDEIQKKTKALVLDQCSSWYLRNGKNVSLYPDSVAQFDASLSHLDIAKGLLFQ